MLLEGAKATLWSPRVFMQGDKFAALIVLPMQSCLGTFPALGSEKTGPQGSY